MKMLQKHWKLIAIVLVGFMLRMWQVGTLTAVLNRDEAALAYNALLLKETGKDEWQQTWPLALQSFGDYKLIGYPTVLVASFSVFGYNDVAVRLPSVLAGTALIYLGYLFTKRVLQLEKNYALIVAALIAVQPVFFFYSRIAFEANVALLLFVLLLICLFDQKKEESKNRVLSLVAILGLGLAAVFTYNTPLLLLPFVILAVVLWFGVKEWKKWLVPVVVLLIICGAGFSSLFSLSAQKSGITIFSDENVWKQSVEYHNQFSGPLQKILGSKYVFYTQIILSNYVKSFSPQFLVLKGGEHPWHTLNGWGHVYLLTYIFAIVGIVQQLFVIVQYLLKHFIHKKKEKFPTVSVVFIYLLFVSLLPSVVTVDAPHATRSLFFFFLLMLFAVKGLEMIVERVKDQNKVFFSFAMLLGFTSILYLTAYFRTYGTQSYTILQGGLCEVIQKVESDNNKSKVAVIDDAGYFYIQVAWCLKMKPETFFSTVQKHLPDRIGFRYGYKVGKYRFIVSPADRLEDEDTLIIREQGKWEIK